MATKKKVKKTVKNSSTKTTSNSTKVKKEQPKKTKTRMLALTVWLWLIVIVNGLAGITYLTTDFTSAFPNADPYIFTVFALISFFNVYLAYLLFNWRKVGFYMFAFVALFLFSVNYSAGVEFLFAISGLIGPVILYLLMRPQWHMFE